MSLERELLELEREWPETPDVAATVMARLSAAPPARLPRRRPQPVRRWAAAALVVLLALAVAAAAVEPVRAEIERLLGIAGGESVERTDRVPGGERLDLGMTVSPGEARRRAGFVPRLPARLGRPAEVRLGGDLGARSVSLVYADTIVTETPRASSVGVVKQIGGGVGIRAVEVHGRTAFWVAAGPRGLRIPGPGGTGRSRRTALAGSSVLLWDRAGIGYRIETRRALAEALAVARSIAVR